MKVVAVQLFRGPHVAGHFGAVRWVLEGALAPLPDPQGLDARLRALFESVTGVAPGIGSSPSSCMAVLALKYALALQRAHHHPVRKGKLGALDGGRCELIIEFAKPRIARPLRECVLALLAEAAGGSAPGTFANVHERNRARLRFGLTHTYLYDRQKVARRLGVPAWHEGARRFMYFGDGCEARLTSGGHTDRTPVLSTQLENDKARAAQRLAACGLPAARQQLAVDEDAAVRAAHAMGWPVVVKPRWGKQGQGVAVNLADEEAVRRAFAAARTFGREIIVERFIPGDSYRLLSIDGRFVAAVKTLPPSVRGDGVRSLHQLIDAANRTERRDGVVLNPIRIDAELRLTLESRGLDLDTVPPAGETVVLRGTANQFIGGTTVDVTDLVHPDNRELAAAAAYVCMLDIAGIDFVTTDIGRSWREGFGAIVEVNGGPAFDLHMLPTEGKPRDVSWHLIRAVHPARSPGLVPRFLVTGRYGKKAIIERLLEALTGLDRRTGVLAKKVVTVAGDATAFDSADDAAEAVFTRPDVDTVIVEQSLAGLAEEGSLVERYAVGVLTDAGDAHALEAVLQDPAAGERVLDLAVWLSSVVVVDAADARLRARVSGLPATQVGWVCWERGEPEGLAEHLAAGGFALVREHEAGRRTLVLRLGEERIAFQRPGSREEPSREEAYAAAALIGAGLDPEALAGLLRGDERGHGDVPSALWPCDELEQAFDGAWIHRPGPGWRAGPLVRGLDRVEAGSVAVIEGQANDPEAVAGLELAVRQAFERGASAVVAPLVPDDLPRWRPVLVCDEPARAVALLGAATAGQVG
ncbi:MAG: acetate--CoA ligase family protein [Rhodocyclaceae bacterium]|nr:acetate--CoA ligase family protein [Rhodocyclaceae bacterium]